MHPLKQISKARGCAQAIELWFDLQKGQSPLATLVSLVQQLECFVFLSQRRKNQSLIVNLRIRRLFCSMIYLVDDFLSLRSFAGKRIDASEITRGQQVFTTFEFFSGL